MLGLEGRPSLSVTSKMHNFQLSQSWSRREAGPQLDKNQTSARTFCNSSTNYRAETGTSGYISRVRIRILRPAELFSVDI